MIATHNLYDWTDPPLSDGTVVSDPRELAECYDCLSLIHISNAYRCRCGLVFCNVCLPEGDGSEERICDNCKARRDQTIVNRLFEWLWSI